MSKFSTAIKLIKSNKAFFLAAALKNLNFLFPDKLYLQLMFQCKMGRSLDLKNPRTFNEKLQWLKLYNRNPLYTTLVDKFSVKKWVAERIGEDHIIPTLGVWNNAKDIDFAKLPKQFVLKTTNGGGGDVVICKDRTKLDITQVVEHLNKSLKVSLYKKNREWPYKNVPPRIIAEKYIEDDSGTLVDYKFSCFDGYVDCVMVCLDRHLKDTKFYFFDKEWNLKRLNVRGRNAPRNFTIPKPSGMDEMFEVASKLSKGFPFVRVDLYAVNGHVYFGEMTFYPDSGFDANLLPETDEYFGQLIDLSKITRR
jgi:hypothetical protein